MVLGCCFRSGVNPRTNELGELLLAGPGVGGLVSIDSSRKSGRPSVQRSARSDRSAPAGSVGTEPSGRHAPARARTARRAGSALQLLLDIAVFDLLHRHPSRQLRLPGRPQLDRRVPLVPGPGPGPQDHVRVEQRGARRVRSDVLTEVDETLLPFLRRQPERAQRGPDVLFSEGHLHLDRIQPAHDIHRSTVRDFQGQNLHLRELAGRLARCGSGVGLQVVARLEIAGGGAAGQGERDKIPVEPVPHLAVGHLEPDRVPGTQLEVVGHLVGVAVIPFCDEKFLSLDPPDGDIVRAAVNLPDDHMAA
jgi:hypothetical protein